MSTISLLESLESEAIARAFYTGGLLRIGLKSGMIYSLNNGAVSVVDPINGQTYARIVADDDPIFTFAVNPVNNNEVVTVGKSNLCRHWIISGPHEVTMLRVWSSGHLHPTLCVDISHDGSLVATSSVDKTIKVFSLAGYYSICVYKVHMQDPISLIRFLPHRRALATLGEDNSISIWDLEQPSLLRPLRELKGHMSTVHVMSFSPDGTVMMTSGNDQMVISWNISSLEDVSMVSQVAVFEAVEAVLPLSNNSFVTGGDKGLIRTWKDKKCISSIASGHAAGGLIKFIHQLPQTGEIIAVGADLGISVWSNSTPLEFSRQLLGNMGEVLALKWLPEHRMVVAVNDEFPRIIDSRNFSALAKLEGHSDIVLCVAVGNGGEFIATGSKDQTVRLWSSDTGASSCSYKSVAEMVGHTGPVTAVAFTKQRGLDEGIRVISASEDNCIKVWRTPTTSSKKLIIRSIVAHSKSVNCLAVSGNDKWVASGSQDRTAKIFNIDDGSLVATCSGHKGSIWGVDFSPIEQILATSSRDGTVKLWNIGAPGSPCIRTFEGHDQSVMGCRFLSSGLQLVSCDSIGTMRVWNVRTGECPVIGLLDGQVIAGANSATAALEDFAESETAAKIWTFDLDNNRIASGTNTGSIHVWVDNTEQLVQERQRDRADIAEKDTSIQVLIKAGKFSDAFRNAFDLNRPRLMVEIIREAVWHQRGISVPKFINQSIHDEKSVEKLIKMVQEWQKTSKTCAIAYQLVEAAVAVIGHLVGECNLFDQSKFEGFAEKHLARLTSLSQKCYIIDAILLASSNVPTE